MYERKVSIIMPAYNVENFLVETLDSVLVQEFDDFEVILVNDGSTDRTQEIIDEYREKYPNIIRAFKHENRGQSATRNCALQYVKGEYIAFVDSDDILKPDYLKVLYNACVSEKADIAIGGYVKFVTGTEEIVYKRNAREWEVKFEHELSHVFQYSPCGKMYSTDFILDHNFVFSEGEQLEDGPYGVMTHIVANKVVALDYEGYKYRIHGQSTMGNVRKKQATPKVPYKGVEAAVLKVREYKSDQYTDEVLEYCIIKVLTGLTTNMYKSCDNATRKKVCQYCYWLLDKYFPNASKNPYLGMFKLKELPMVHRVAVALFIKAYKMHMLYPFSVVVSKII